MPLAQTPSNIIQDPRQFMHLVYGDPGTGKTTWCSQISGHYFLTTEPGTGGVSVYGDIILDWPSFLAKCSELKAAKLSGFEGQRRVDTIVIDTYPAMWKMCGVHLAATEKFNNGGRMESFNKVEDVPYGKGYARTNDVCIGVLTQLKALGFGLVLTDHGKETTFKWRGQDMTKITLSGSESVREAITKACDAIGYFVIEEEVKKNDQGIITAYEKGRHAYWQPTFTRIAKHRLRDFPEMTELPAGKGWEVYEKIFRQVAEKNQQEVTAVS